MIELVGIDVNLSIQQMCDMLYYMFCVIVDYITFIFEPAR